MKSLFIQPRKTNSTTQVLAGSLSQLECDFFRDRFQTGHIRVKRAAGCSRLLYKHKFSTHVVTFERNESAEPLWSVLPPLITLTTEKMAPVRCIFSLFSCEFNNWGFSRQFHVHVETRHSWETWCRWSCHWRWRVCLCAGKTRLCSSWSLDARSECRISIGR